ncbi:hypothetical protein AKJ09_11066 [Labilithrix luteola]|uniref:Outer membrane lipoprotein BamD-like domain-containing protein n=1 Tax=Labilithrix luteola TaxID=1391654 RepID=A0A0K1QFA4_9BACT|nr:hypothetical protein [Labilithrix luteola]AKV04403.1 hypothetical protein AKJ09_11066 [Labilithrix luteola]
MSNEDRRFVEQLLDAARHDEAPDASARQARIHEHVVRAAPASAGLAARAFRSWGGFAVAGLGALAFVGVVASVTSRSVKQPPAPAIAAAPSVPVPPAASASVEVVADGEQVRGTSVWELPSVPAPKKAVAAQGEDADLLALELAALEGARKKLREGDAAGAQKRLTDFDRRFPHPRVGDEATVLRIEVLFALGRGEDARRLGQAFVATHPDSIYRARVAQLLGDPSR